MDGMVVLRISSPSIFGWRPKNASRKLRTVASGLEVTRGGKIDSWIPRDRAVTLFLCFRHVFVHGEVLSFISLEVDWCVVVSILVGTLREAGSS